MKADLTKALNLAEEGYWVFPCLNRQKGARAVLGKPWGWYCENSSPEVLAAILSQGNPTGAAIMPAPSDPIPLLILDFDLEGEEKPTWQEIWSIMSTGTPPPPGLGITKSVSGGYHFWFKLGSKKEKLPDKFDFGSGLQGEVRASNRPKTFLMLPGSVALSKGGGVGKYVEQESIEIEKLPEMPEHILTRLSARPTTNIAPEEGALPTEVIHLLDLMSSTPIPQGARNEHIAKVGQIIGRIAPHTNLPDEMLESAWNKLKPGLGDFKLPEFTKTLKSGFKTGKTNGGKFLKRSPNPTASDVKAECETVFGGALWMKKLIDSTGKCVGYTIGIGGSAKRPDEAAITIQLEDLDPNDLLPYLAQAAGVNPNSIVTSPLFVQGGWRKVLLYILKSESSVEPLALPPEDVFFDIISNWARGAATDDRFIERWAERREFDKGAPFIVYPPDGMDTCLVIPERSYERLLRQVGDIGIGKSLTKKWLLTKSLIGRARAWVIGTENLDEPSKLIIHKAYEKRIARKLNAPRTP